MIILKRILATCALLLVASYLALVVYAYWPTGIETMPAKELATAEDRFADVNGLELRYRTYGEPAADKPNLLLLHGMGNSLQSFRLLAPLLQDDFFVVALDMPGFGLSSKPSDYDYRAGSMAATVGEFARAIGLERYAVGGHSMGGAIALLTAINEPEVSGLILMNPGIINDGVPEFTRYMPFPFQRISAKQFGDRNFRERFLKISYINTALITDEVMDDLQLAARTDDYLAGATSMMGQYEEPVGVAPLADVTVPTLIAWGEQDLNKNETELQQLQEGLTNTQVSVVKVADSGHYVHEEGAAPVARAMIEAAPLWR